MEHKDKNSPQETLVPPAMAELAQSLGLDNPTPAEAILADAAIRRAATKLLASRLYDSISPADREEFKQALEGNNLLGMITLMRKCFPNYDELQQQAIEQAKENVRKKADIRHQEEKAQHRRQGTERGAL